jgi:hypothetical protein
MSPFDLLGVLVGIYAGYSALTGSVFAKHRAWGRTVYRDQTPWAFWSTIVVYALLAVALVVIF